ncbi:DUF2474 family protein [Roseivivax sp. THAF30]|nr:DUF2474 family protein [Roseivivax sp. THAF30]QFT63869.1 hypothetical protein FIU91_13105 [Roseivivax sp. THAF30]
MAQDPRPTKVKLAWFVVIWAASITTLGIVAWLIRLVAV